MMSRKVSLAVLALLACLSFSSSASQVIPILNAPDVEHIPVGPPPVLVAPEEEPLEYSLPEVSPNLIDNGSWEGATYGPDPGGCCRSISGSGALYDTNTQTIMFSYGRDILHQTIAINQALALSGIQVDGYQYEWKYRLIANAFNRNDELKFEVTVKDSNGNEVEHYVYDYSGQSMGDDWIHESGVELFRQSYTDPQSVQMKIIGKDGGFWAGYYGPEVRDVDLRLIYTADPCSSDPLYDPSCPGYAEAYAEQLYISSCSANPLYDIGCPGYDQAYYNQQCSANPLYDSGCVGYSQAYFEQQCSIDVFYNESCPGYADAYYDRQCGLDPLYDPGCPRYEVAYHDLQCSIDDLYMPTCPGYAEAYFDQQCSNNPLYDSGCPGYEQAYYDQQCGVNTLYDVGCPGYEQAYYDQQCGVSALYDTGCPGYDEAYYDQQCSLNPLYDSGCNGYENAYYTYQCLLDPLYDTQCPGYQQAYYDQQCSLDPLYDTGCPGYQQAYYDQQCSLDSLYDSGCPGYQQAYYDQQCGLDSLYDSGCPGYEEAYFNKYVKPGLEAQEKAVVETPVAEPTTSNDIVMPEVAVTGDSTVDSILQENNNVAITQVDVGGSNIDPPQMEVEETSREAEVSVQDVPTEREDTSEEIEQIEVIAESSEEESEPEAKQESKKEKIKKAMTKKAQELAESMSEAASLEVQKAAQAQVLALINYVPDFGSYGGVINGGVYPDANLYNQEQLPETRRGLRNGLAQQILHEKMVDMQYDR